MHVELELLVQPLSDTEGKNEGNSTVPLCTPTSEGPCGRDTKGRSGERCGSMYGKPCNHSGGGGNGTDTACAIMSILDFISGVFESPPGFVASAYCAGYAAGEVVRNG